MHSFPTLLSQLHRLKLDYENATDAPRHLYPKTGLPGEPGAAWDSGRREVAVHHRHPGDAARPATALLGSRSCGRSHVRAKQTAMDSKLGAAYVERMPLSDNSRGHDYDMPTALAHALVRGTTWALSCPACRRKVAVDVIRMVEGVADVRDFDSKSTLRQAKCKDCGERLKHTGGYTLGSLKNSGHMPQLVMVDASDWRRPTWQLLHW